MIGCRQGAPCSGEERRDIQAKLESASGATGFLAVFRWTTVVMVYGRWRNDPP